MADQRQSSECRCFDGLVFPTSPPGSPSPTRSAVDDATSFMQKLVVDEDGGGAKSKRREAVSEREARREKRREKREEERKLAASKLPRVPDMLCVDERGGAVMKISHPGIYHPPRPENVGLKCLRQAVEKIEGDSPGAGRMMPPPRPITPVNARSTMVNPRKDSRCPTYGVIGDVLVIELSDAEEMYGPLPDPKSM